MSNKPFLLYLHGFLSSPLSKKARQTVLHCEQTGLVDISVPKLHSGPSDTIAELRVLIDALENARIVLMGSSLGGYYATFLAEEYGFPAVLINPAVRPFDFWRSHVGEHKNYYSDDVHVVTEKHIQELKDLEIINLTNPDNFMVLVQTGDETLDYRQAVEKFGSSHCIVRENGNHSYENFDSELPAIFDFLLSRIG